MAFDSTADNLAIAAVAEVAVQVSLHSSDPGTGASNELSGGSYARGTVTWGTPSGGIVKPTADIAIQVPAGATVAYAAFWSSDGTTRYAKQAFASPETFANAGTFTLSAAQTSLTFG